MVFMQKKISLSIVIAYFYVFYIIVDPNHEQFLYRAIGLLIAWLITSLLENTSKLLYSLFNKYTVPIYIFLIFILITGQIYGDFIYILKQIGYYTIFFSPVFLLLYYYDRQSKNKKFIYIIIMAFLYTTIVSTIYYANNPDIARRIASGIIIDDNINMIGGYSLAYSAVISATFLLEVLIKKRNLLTSKLKLLIVALVISQVFLVIYTRSTLTLIWLIIGFTLVLFSNISILIRQKTVTKFISVVSLITIVFIFIVFKNEIGIYLYTFNQNTSNIVNLRINSIGEFLLGYNLNSNHFIYRLRLPITSLRSFISSPIIGVGYQYGYYAERIYDYLGGHGEWADILGSTGLIGFISYLFAIILIPIYNHKRILENRISYSYLIVLFCLGLFNPLRSIHLTLTIFLFIPLFSLCFLKLPEKKTARGNG